MKKIFFLSLLISFPLAFSAQGILNNGAHIVMNGAASNIYIDSAAGNYKSQAGGLIDPLVFGPTVTLLGNWINNSANVGFSFDGSNVNFSGAAQTIGGTNFTHFYNVNLLGSNTKTLLVQTRVGGFGGVPNGVLSLGTRPLDLNSFDLWVFNPAAGAITNTTGYIQSETNVSLNPSQVRWFIGTNTGARIIPFGTAGGIQIPLTVNTTAALPLSTSYFVAATRPTAVNLNTPWAATVTQMYDPTLLADGSAQAVIDRWWEFTYSAASTATITFSYRGAENTLFVPYNTGNIGAQYWLGAWVPNNACIGSAPAVLAGVGAVTAAGIPFLAATYQPMILSSLGAPLPIELTSFTSECNKGQELLSWTTASESNNDYFTIERSDDGLTFRDIGTVQGNGTTSQQHNYTFADPQAVTGNAYYRLRQTDFNGQHSTSQIIVGEQCGSNTDFINAFSSGQGIDISINNAQSSSYQISIFDARGRLISKNEIATNEGLNHFNLNDVRFAEGIYLINIVGSHGEFFSRKLVLGLN